MKKLPPGSTSRNGAPLVRGPAVVRNILRITLDELASCGFAALRVDDVAQRAGVNKTTVYRRWPTKTLLVRAALLTIGGDEISPPNTGSLRSDLVAIGHQFVELASAPQWKSLVRVILAEGPSSELGRIAQSLRESYEPFRRAVIREAVQRKEVANMKQGLFLMELFDAWMHFRFFVSQIGVSRAFIERVADILVAEGLTKRPLLREAKASESPFKSKPKRSDGCI